jgi:glycosyltransferase involved in cell wall biosynthesis
MKDVVLTICRDECDVIEAFVRFYLSSAFDEVHVVDNGSVDGTPERVEELVRSGLPVFLVHDPRLGYERFLTDHYRRVGKISGARWIFFLDCDEFVLFPGNAKAYLDALPPDVSCLRLKQKEMYPLVSETAHRDCLSFLMTTRAEPEFNNTTKDVTCFHPEAIVYAGKHLIRRPGLRIQRPNDFFIRHYKYRSLAQARRKESNRIQAHTSYSPEELARLSSFGAERTLEWFTLCRYNAEREAWRKSFSPNIPFSEDRELVSRLPELLGRVPLNKSNVLLA